MQIAMSDLAAPGQTCLHYLFESWCNADGDWRKSCVYVNVCSKNSRTRRGVKRWLTYQELVSKLGETVAFAIVEHKRSVQDSEEVRDHPDCPGVKARCYTISSSCQSCYTHYTVKSLAACYQEAQQFWVLDSEAEEEIQEDWISKLLTVSEDSGSPKKSFNRRARIPKGRAAKAKVADLC